MKRGYSRDIRGQKPREHPKNVLKNAPSRGIMIVPTIINNYERSAPVL